MENSHQRTAHSVSPSMRVSHQYQKPRAASPDLDSIPKPTRQSSPNTDRNQERQSRKKLPTVDEAIGWITEQGFRLGTFGFSLGSFSASRDAFKDIVVDTSINPYGSDDDVVTAMEQMHANITRVTQQAQIVGVNKPLQESMSLEVNRRLLALSSDPKAMRREIPRASLARRIGWLYPLEHPTPALPMDSVPGHVCLTPLARHTVKVNLPIKAEISEVYSLLKGLLRMERAILSNEMREIDDESILWTYRFVLGSSPVYDKPAEPLSTDIDYRMMINQIIRKRIPRLTSVLLEMEGVGANKSEGQMRNGEADKGVGSVDSMGKAKRYKTEDGKAKICLSNNSREPSPNIAPSSDSHNGDYAEDNIFDEDGNPYFDEGPIDWNKFSSTYLNNKIGFPDAAVIQGKGRSTLTPEQQQSSKYNLRPRR